MNWQDVEKELRNRPLEAAAAPSAFWANFRERAAAAGRTESVPEPLGFGRWCALAAAAAALIAGMLVMRPAPVEPTLRLASTEVKSVDVVASHAGVIIMNDDAGGTVLWIADLELNQTKGN